MADASLIAEVLRNDVAQKNQPSPVMGNIQEVMKGIAQGIQLYDSIKGLGLKYGDRKFASGVTSTQPTTLPSIAPSQPTMFGGNSGGQNPLLSLLQPGAAGVPSPSFSSAASPSFPQPQGPGVATQAPGQWTGNIGLADAELINKAGETFPQVGRDLAENRYGIATGDAVKEGLTPYISTDANGIKTVEYFKKRPVESTAGIQQQKLQNDKELIQLRKQELGLKFQEFEQNVKQFNQTLAERFDNNQADNVRQQIAPFLEAITGKNAKKADAGMYEFVNRVIKETTENGGVLPEFAYERGKAFGTIPWKGKPVVKDKSGTPEPTNDLEKKAKDFLTKNGKKASAANIQYAINQGWVK